MLNYAIRRVFILIPTVFAAVTFLFFLFYLLPGDPVEFIAGGGGERAIPENVRANIEERYGLSDPWYERFVDYWSDVAPPDVDLGRSFQTNDEVTDVVQRTATASLRLGIWAILIEILVGIAVGLVSAVRRYSLADKATTFVTAAASAIPVFVLGFVLQQGFAVFPFQHDWPAWARLRVQSIGPDTWTFFFIPTGEQWRYLLLPAVTLASVSTALAARMTRGSMLEVLRADYMRTARAKGLSEGRILRRHGLRNAMIPVITLIGIDFGTIIGAAILTETVFSWPGIGSQIARGIALRDSPLVLGLTLVVVAVYSLINLVVDLSYAFLDPRIRHGRQSTT